MKARLLLHFLAACLIFGTAAVFAVAVHRGHRCCSATQCANNLSQLWRLQHLYSAGYAGSPGGRGFPQQTGKAFWLHLAKMQPPLINPSNEDLLLCPIQGEGDPGDIQYLGPARPCGSLREEDPVGCDRPLNHGQGREANGNVLWKAGHVDRLERKDWKAFLDSARCAP